MTGKQTATFSSGAGQWLWGHLMGVFGLLFVLGSSACSSSSSGPIDSPAEASSDGKDMEGDAQMSEQQVLEIAVRKVKPDQVEAFKSKRSAFIAHLKTLNGVVADGEFQVQLSGGLTGPPDTESVIFVGMTTWASKDAYDAAAKSLEQAPVAGEFFATFDFLSYGQYRPTDGRPIDLDQLLSAGYLELPIRTIATGTSQGDFQSGRDALVDLLKRQPGFAFNREYTSVAGDGVLVGVVAWNSGQDVRDAFPAIIEAPAMKRFLPMMDFVGYFQMVPAKVE